MATTAAGVAAGAFLFKGINHLVDGHRTSSLLGANPLSSPATGSEGASSNSFIGGPPDSGVSVADSSAGFDDLPDAGSDTFSD